MKSILHFEDKFHLSKCCCCSSTQSCLPPCNPMDCSTPAFVSFTISWNLLKVMSIESIPPSVTPEGILLVLNPSQHQSLFQCQRFALGGQSIGPLASVLLMNIQSWLPLGLTGLISLLTKGLSKVFSSSTVQMHQFFSAQPSIWSNSHICKWLLEKIIALTIWTFVGEVMSLLFNMLSKFVIAFLPRSRCL